MAQLVGPLSPFLRSGAKVTSAVRGVPKIRSSEGRLREPYTINTDKEEEGGGGRNSENLADVICTWPSSRLHNISIRASFIRAAIKRGDRYHGQGKERRGNDGDGQTTVV